MPMRLKVKRTICRVFGHDWNRWKPLTGDPYDLEDVRICKRCPAYETTVNRDWVGRGH